MTSVLLLFGDFNTDFTETIKYLKNDLSFLINELPSVKNV